MPVAIAPDPDYSIPGCTRVIYYCRPAKQFAEYVKQEYVAPDDQVAALVMAIFDQLQGKAHDLSHFLSYQQNTQHLREMLVCTHTQVDLACGRFGTPLHRQLRQTYGQPGQSLRVWQSTHFSGHQFAPTLVDLPTGQFWGHLEPEVLPQLVKRNGDPHQMRRFSRGWAGCNRFEQIADREVWMQEGWDWFSYPRTVQTTRKGLDGLKRLLYPILRWVPLKLVQLWLEHWTNDASWVDMTIAYTSPKGKGIYYVSIEEKGEVTSALKSPISKHEPVSTVPVKQYQISHLSRGA